MLYHILPLFRDQVSWLRVFQYQTFRVMLAFLIAFFFVLVLEPAFISWLKRVGIKGQPIRDDGPKDHLGKQGTPTMGGLVIIAAVLTSTVLLADLTNVYVWLSVTVLLAFSVLGFLDDWRKVRQQDSKGLTERQKLLTQIGIALFAAAVLLILGFSTELAIPFTKESTIWLGPFFLVLVVLVVIGTSNAVNLTDGLDGLAIGPVMTVAATYALFAYLGGNSKIADHLELHYVPGVGEVSIILSSVVAAGLGFLWYNTFPAQVFMGDTGALALGGLLGFAAILVKHEIVLVVAGGVFCC